MKAKAKKKVNVKKKVTKQKPKQQNKRKPKRRRYPPNINFSVELAKRQPLDVKLCAIYVHPGITNTVFLGCLMKACK